MPNFVNLDEVWAMLDDCLAGYERKANEEYWTIKFNGRSYRRIPVGPHGRKHNISVQSGHIRSLVRFFEIQDCAARLLDLT
jgi:hypothetical protein